MAFAEKIRLRLGESKLRKKLKDFRREKLACNLGEAHAVGILFDASDPTGFEPVKRLAAQLGQRNIGVQIIGYVNDKKVPDAYLLRKNFNFISRNELNWIFKPKADFVEEFMVQPYDILFNLDLRNHFPLRYISSLSKARFKTGLYKDENVFLDFMIDLHEQASLDALISQLVIYLDELRIKAV